MACHLATVVCMTELNNSNANDEQPSSRPDYGQESAQNNDFDAAWAQFEQEHAEDLRHVAQSRNAKRFEKHAQRKEKEALLSIDDLDRGTFTDDFQRRGPRDFTGSSWLDTDDVMDRYGDDFVPPNPTIGRVPVAKALFWGLLIAGIIGVIASVFFPALAAILGTIFGMCILIGGAGLLAQHKGHSQTRSDMLDDGARV